MAYFNKCAKNSTFGPGNLFSGINRDAQASDEANEYLLQEFILQKPGHPLYYGPSHLEFHR